MKRVNYFLSFTLIVSFLISIASCSNKLPDETVPVTSGTEAETTVVETEAIPETTETKVNSRPTMGPTTTPAVLRRPVDDYGKLYVEGTNLMSSVTGEPVQLKGMSTYGLYAMYNFVNVDTVQTLAEDWGCSVLRLAMYDDMQGDGYVANPEKYFNQMCEYTDLCIDQGIYVIADWHILYDGDPNLNKEQAMDFFDRYSAIYSEYDNVIYEICNEPNGKCCDDPSRTVDWENCIRPYAVDLVDVIRKNDPDNIIIIGTSTWSQDVDIASQNPLEGENLMYTFHFYAGSHKDANKQKLLTAIDNGLPIFVTEWGATLDTGGGGVYPDESDAWLEILDEHNISWCNWSIGSGAPEDSNALYYYTSLLDTADKLKGHWPLEYLSPSGVYVRGKILEGQV